MAEMHDTTREANVRAAGIRPRSEPGPERPGAEGAKSGKRGGHG